MKGRRKNAVEVACFFCGALILIACTSIPWFVWRANQEEADTDMLIVYADYSCYAESFEFGKPITIATDRDFTNILWEKSSMNEDGRYTYRIPVSEPVETIYIDPAILYIPIEIDPVSFSLGSDDRIVTLDGEDWLSVPSVEVFGTAVTVTIDLINDTLPISPKLEIDGVKIAGSYSLNFNEDNSSNYGKFVVNLPNVSVDAVSNMLEKASLIIEGAMLKVIATDATYSCDDESLEIIVVEAA